MAGAAGRGVRDQAQHRGGPSPRQVGEQRAYLVRPSSSAPASKENRM